MVQTQRPPATPRPAGPVAPRRALKHRGRAAGAGRRRGRIEAFGHQGGRRPSRTEGAPVRRAAAARAVARVVGRVVAARARAASAAPKDRAVHRRPSHHYCIGTPGPTSPPEVDFRFLGQCWQQPRNSSFRSLIRDRTRCTTAGERNRVTLDAARADYRPACRWRRVAAAPPHDLVRVLSARNLDWSARRSVSAGPSDYLAGLGRRASAPRRRPTPRARSRGAPGDAAQWWTRRYRLKWRG